MGCTSLTSLLLTMESKLNFWWDSCLNDWRLTSWPSSSSSSSFPIASPVFSLKRYVKQPRKWYKLLINYHYKTLKCMTHQAAMENSVWFIHSNDLLTFSQFSRHFFIFFSFLDSTTIKWKMTFLHLDSESLFNKQASIPRLLSGPFKSSVKYHEKHAHSLQLMDFCCFLLVCLPFFFDSIFAIRKFLSIQLLVLQQLLCVGSFANILNIHGASSCDDSK